MENEDTHLIESCLGGGGDRKQKLMMTNLQLFRNKVTSAAQEL